MEDLQQAYQAYQQALYHLRDPKVRYCSGSVALPGQQFSAGTKALVRYRYTLRSIWLLGARRGSLFPSHANAA